MRGVDCVVQDNESIDGFEFEILKLTFFIVSYLLIMDSINDNNASNISSFYNTLFIFSVSTWIDYLSSLYIQNRKRYYDGKGMGNSYIPLLGSIIGIFTVSVSLYCVCEKSDELLQLAIVVYYLSAIYILFKAILISEMILKKFK